MVSPLSGVVDEIVATIGPVPVFDWVLTLKVYEVQGLNSDTVMEVVFTSDTGISHNIMESGPSTCTVYPVTIVFSSCSGWDFQEISAVVGVL